MKTTKRVKKVTAFVKPAAEHIKILLQNPIKTIFNTRFIDSSTKTPITPPRKE